MWAIKERITGFLVFFIFIVILFSPARGYCVTLKGILELSAGGEMSDVLIYIYNWEALKTQGLAMLSAVPPVGLTFSEGNPYNFLVDLEDAVSSDKLYVVVFSTIRRTASDYPSFFYGAYQEANYSNPSKYKQQPRWWNLDNIPKIRFPKDPETFETLDLDLLTFTPPEAVNDQGVRLSGIIKGQSGYLGGVGVELYIDQDGVPVSNPIPFALFDITTGEGDSSDNNFTVRRVLKGIPYYIKLIANKKGYVDTFYLEDPEDPDSEPKKFPSLTGSDFIEGEYILSRKGAKISGTIKDENGNVVTDSVIRIRAISDNADQPYTLSYVHDPNYGIYDALSPVEKYFYGYDRYNYTKTATGVPTGRYVIDGLPFEDNNYYVIAEELEIRGDAFKKFATPVMFDANDGAFDSRQAKKIIFSETATEFTADFYLQDCACIEGYIDVSKELSSNAKADIAHLIHDPNILNKDRIPLSIEAYLVGTDGSLSSVPLGSDTTEGTSNYRICGLPPKDFMLRSTDYAFYPIKYFDNQPTFITGEIISTEIGSQVTGKNINMSLGGMLKGRVKDSDGNYVSKASVFVNQINAGNPLVGYFFINSEGAFLAQYSRETDENGNFYFWGLPEGLYTVFVNGYLVNEDTGFFPQFYTDTPVKTMVTNQVSPKFITENNPDFIPLNEFQLEKSGTNSGGIISGKISLSSSVPSTVSISSSEFYPRLLYADTGIEISNPLFKVDDPVDNERTYQVMVPHDGDYILSFQDGEGKLLPHYYRQEGTTINLAEASPLNVSQTTVLGDQLGDKNFFLSKVSGTISGEVLDSGDKGVPGLYIDASQQIMEGPDKGTWKSVRKAETDSQGKFTLEALYEGTYIFSVSDPDLIYAPMYDSNDPNPYTPDKAITWTYDSDSSSNPPAIDFNVQKCGRIVGRVSEEFVGTKLFLYRMKAGKPVTGLSYTADPNFNIPALIPGEYVLGFKDPNNNYLATYYTQSGFTTDYDLVNPSDLTIGLNTTISVGEMSFTELGATIKGQIKQMTSTTPEPLLNTYIFLYDLRKNREYWATTPAQFTATDSNGNYTLNGLSTGNYKIIAFGPQYRPISKYLTIVEDDLGDEISPVNLTFPLESVWQNDKYDKVLELEEGLNLVAYPTRIPPYVTGYSSLSFLKDIVLVNGHGRMTMKTISTSDQRWRTASFDNAKMEGIQVTGVYGSNYSISNGQGFLLYSQEGPTINFRYFPGQTSLWLREGVNLVGNVPFDPNMADIDETDLVSDPDFTTKEMLAQMGEDASVSIQTFEATEGKWQATYWMWGKPAGEATQVEDERGYLVTMKKELNNWYPTNNN